MNVNLAPELEKFIQTAVEAGRYSSANEVVSAALRLLQEHMPVHQEEIEPLHARVDGALLSLTRGEGEEGEAYVENPDGKLEKSQEAERPVRR